MSVPLFAKKKNGLPIISKTQMDDLGQALVKEFCPEALENPMPLNIDHFAAEYLGMEIRYDHLSHNGIYLGMTVFCDSDKVPIYNPRKHEADYISVEGGTILIESNLAQEKNLSRYRFTVAHECGHGYLHSVFFSEHAGYAAARGSGTPLIRCRIENNPLPKNEEWTDEDWMEWQADRFASALLMPKAAVMKHVEKNTNAQDDLWAAGNIVSTARAFKVSLQAAEIRLRDLGFLDGFSDLDLDHGMSFFPYSRRYGSNMPRR